MGGVPDLPFGLVTTPGDLPVTDVADAVALCLREADFPTVPVLPTPAGSLVAQAIGPLDGVHLLPTGDLRVDTVAFGVRPDSLEDLSGPAFAALHEFVGAWRPARSARPSIAAVRVDLVGPVTLSLALMGAGLPQPQAMDAARLVCARRAASLFAALRAVEPVLPVTVVMSEPRLVGSMHPTFPLSVRQVRSLLDPVVDALDVAAADTPVLIGIHVPGKSDWQTIVTSGVSFVSMPPDPGLTGWAPWVQALLDNGGFIAWGALPVDRPLGTSEELLWRHLSATWSDLVAAGVDPALLRQRCLIGPADGLARFAEPQVDGIRHLLTALGDRVRSQAIGTRLTVGA